MSHQHTAGKLAVCTDTQNDQWYKDITIYSQEYGRVADVCVLSSYYKENARRLVACWNACVDIEDPEAEIAALRKDRDYLSTSERLRAQVNEQRDELLIALRNLVGTPDAPNSGWRGTGGTDILFACEHCRAKDIDCAAIKHKPECPVSHAFAVIAKCKIDDVKLPQPQDDTKHPEESPWRPIETAPKDGTEVLVMYMSFETQIVHNAFYCADDADDRPGWWSYDKSETSRVLLDDHWTPTHWMPLPPAPNGSQLPCGK